MATKQTISAVKSMLFGIGNIASATTDFLSYEDETETAIIESLNLIHQQVYAMRQLLKKIPV